MEYLLIVAFLLLLLDIQAWLSNRQMDRSWHKMHEAYMRQMESTYSPAHDGDGKAFYSKALLRRLVPALVNARDWDNGYAHSLLYPISQ